MSSFDQDHMAPVLKANMNGSFNGQEAELFPCGNASKWERDRRFYFVEHLVEKRMYFGFHIIRPDQSDI